MSYYRLPLGADIQHEVRQFPAHVPLDGVEPVAARALAVVAIASTVIPSLEAHTARIAKTNLDKVSRGLFAVTDRARKLRERSKDPRAPAPPDIMAELRKWSTQAFIESNAIAEGVQGMREAQSAFWDDLTSRAAEVGQWMLKKGGQAIHFVAEPVQSAIKWLLIIGGVLGGIYVYRRLSNR